MQRTPATSEGTARINAFPLGLPVPKSNTPERSTPLRSTFRGRGDTRRIEHLNRLLQKPLSFTDQPFSAQQQHDGDEPPVALPERDVAFHDPIRSQGAEQIRQPLELIFAQKLPAREATDLFEQFPIARQVNELDTQARLDSESRPWSEVVDRKTGDAHPQLVLRRLPAVRSARRNTPPPAVSDSSATECDNWPSRHSSASAEACSIGLPFSSRSRTRIVAESPGS